jgi:hypothetical protein
MTDNYKSSEDPQRAFYLISACNIMRDFPKTNALAASFIRELHAMNERQAERDAAEKKQAETRVAPPRINTDAIRRGA